MSLPRVLIVDDDPEMVRLVQAELGRLEFDVIPTTSGGDGLQALRDHPVDVVVTDLRMPDLDGMELLRAAADVRPEAKVIMITAFGSIASAIEAMRAGAFDYLSKPFELDELVLAVQKALEDARLRRENVLLRGEVERRYRFENLVGASREMQEVFRLIERVAASDIAVLITGESGTGKEVVAKAIHYNGPRRRGRFLPINCAGIPETLLESELFGYTRGAFTGAAASRKGLIEDAQGGTLFLDEIAEMPMLLQAKLLRVLEDKEVRPLGSNRGTTVDFRVIAASNKSLRALVARGAFREDLFFRLNVATIHLPPSATGARTSACSSITSSRSRRPPRGGPCTGSAGRRWAGWRTTRGRGTCANCRTRSSAPWPLPAPTSSSPRTSPPSPPGPARGWWTGPGPND